MLSHAPSVRPVITSSANKMIRVARIGSALPGIAGKRHQYVDAGAYALRCLGIARDHVVPLSCRRFIASLESRECKNLTRGVAKRLAWLRQRLQPARHFGIRCAVD